MKMNIKNLQHRRLWTDSMIGMTYGFIASLIVGTIIGLFAINQSHDFAKMLKNIKSVLTYITGFAIGVGIGIKAKLNPLQIIGMGIAVFICAQSTLHPKFANGAFTWSAKIGINTKWLPGDVFAAFISGVLLLYFFNIIKWDFQLDILVVPLAGIIIGIIQGFFITYLTSSILVIIEWIIYNTANKHHYLGILLAPVIGMIMGLALSLPTSSAAIAFAVHLKGDAATAAIAGTAAQMISFGVITYLSTKSLSKAFAVGLGTSMLQIKNFGKKPKLLLLPMLISGITAIMGVAIVPLAFGEQSVTSGMGSCGLYGQIFTLEENGWTNLNAWMNVIFIQLITPLILTSLSVIALKKYNLFELEDFKI